MKMKSLRRIELMVTAWVALVSGGMANARADGVVNSIVSNGTEPSPLNIADGKTMSERARLASLDAELNARRAFGCELHSETCLHFRKVSEPRQLNSPSMGVFPYYVSGQVLINGEKSICGGKSNGHGHGGHLPGNCLVEQTFTIAAPDEAVVFGANRGSIGGGVSVRFVGEKKDAGTPVYEGATADAQKLIRAEYQSAYLKNFNDRKLCGNDQAVFVGFSEESFVEVPYTSFRLFADYINSETDSVSAATVIRVMKIHNLRSAIDLFDASFGAEAGLVALQGGISAWVECKAELASL